MLLGDSRLVKHFAALQSSCEIIGFRKEDESADRGTLFVPFKADLPGLYGRAAVLHSGVLPYEEGKFLLYPNISENMAIGLFNLLMR